MRHIPLFILILFSMANLLIFKKLRTILRGQSNADEIKDQTPVQQPEKTSKERRDSFPHGNSSNINQVADSSASATATAGSGGNTQVNSNSAAVNNNEINNYLYSPFSNNGNKKLNANNVNKYGFNLSPFVSNNDETNKTV